MVLMAIIGELGSGKTLSLTYLGVRNFLQDRKIYSNYHLAFKHNYVEKPEDIDGIRQGVFLGDELWAWIDSRCSPKKRNRFVSSILLKSRKRGYEIIYTLQDFSQIDKRIRRITDFIARPMLYPDNSKCIVPIFDLKAQQRLKTLQFNPKKYFKYYDTTEEIDEYSESRKDSDD